jgi:hypothetical protein
MDEVRFALERYQTIAPEFMPEGPAVRCNIITHGGVSVVAGKDGAPGQKKYQLSGNELLKPMIGFCIDHKIMLPREAQKVIEFQQNFVVLRIDFTFVVNLAVASY